MIDTSDTSKVLKLHKPQSQFVALLNRSIALFKDNFCSTGNFTHDIT